jgi:hypothetical protein
MKKTILLFALFGFLMFPATVQAALPPWVEYIIAYDGYVERHTVTAPFFTADTLFVINNTHPIDWMNVWVEVFEKKGNLVWEGEVWDGGVQVPQIAPNGFGWFTLGMILNMIGLDTVDPFGNLAAEKFFVRISCGHLQNPIEIVPTVEVKQVIYKQEVVQPGLAIWKPWLIGTWSEAALGGNRRTTGVIWPP